MATLRTLRILRGLPVALTISLALFAFLLAPGLSGPTPWAAPLLGGLLSAWALMGHLRVWPGVERAVFLVAAVYLLLVSVVALHLEVVPLYGIMALIVLRGELGGLRRLFQPLEGMALREEQAAELRRAIGGLFLRLTVILASAFLLSVAVWWAVPLLDVGTTSEFAAFIAAAALIFLAALLFAAKGRTTSS